jgi:hypothetical protein
MIEPVLWRDLPRRLINGATIAAEINSPSHRPLRRPNRPSNKLNKRPLPRRVRATLNVWYWVFGTSSNLTTFDALLIESCRTARSCGFLSAPALLRQGDVTRTRSVVIRNAAV